MNFQYLIIIYIVSQKFKCTRTKYIYDDKPDEICKRCDFN